MSEIDYEIALLGPEERSEVTFHLNDTVSSVLTEVESEAPEKEQRSMSTLDTLVSGTPFAEPDFLKLDVQGYELEILRGGRRPLPRIHPR
jgi:FkbM family methyltransferase